MPLNPAFVQGSTVYPFLFLDILFLFYFDFITLLLGICF